MRHVVTLAVGGALFCATSSVLADYVSPLSFVDQPGTVLMIDGKDSDSLVKISITTRQKRTGLDFGFVTGDGFYSFSSGWRRTQSQQFAGGALVDFAVRSRGADGKFGTADDQIFSLSDPADYANQYYSDGIDPSRSRNPQVTDPYYRNLSIIWDVNHDGVTDLTVTLRTWDRSDGMSSAAPVPLPAAAWMFGSGLAVLAATLVRRRRRTVLTTDHDLQPES